MIDAHIHLWDLKYDYPWLDPNAKDFEILIGNYDKLKQNFLIDDFLKLSKPLDIKKSVHIEAGGFPDDKVAESRWLQAIADKCGHPHAIVANIDLCAKNCKHDVDRHLQFTNVKGFRMLLNWHKNPKLRLIPDINIVDTKQFQDNLSYLEQKGLCFDIHIFADQLPLAEKLAKAFPKLNFIIDHLGWPIDISDSGFDLWREHLQNLKLPNIYMKISSVGCVFRDQWKKFYAKYMHACIKILGEDKILFGSNFLPDSLFASYEELVKEYKNVANAYSKTIQKKLLTTNAEHAYNI